MYSKELMSNIYWGFYGGKYNSREVFIQEVVEYNTDLGKVWNPDEIVLDCQNVTIQYSYWNNDKNNAEEKDFDLVSDNPTGFTSGELLFKIHNEVVDQLEKEDYRFFEGLTLWKRKNNDDSDTPLYFINQTTLEEVT